jgi:hypothetical protein
MVLAGLGMTETPASAAECNLIALFSTNSRR